MNATAKFELPASKLTLTEEQLLANNWEGMCISTAERGAVLVLISQSALHPGYFDCRVVGGAGATATNRPVSACAVGLQLDCILDHYGYSCADVRWTSIDKDKQRTESITSEVVYFARAGEFIKIGKATGGAAARIACLQTGCPFPITVLATVPGGLKLEAELHRRFASLRTHGEWFHVAPLLMAFIEGLTLAGAQQ